MDSRELRQRAEEALCKAVIVGGSVVVILFVLYFLRVVYGP